MDANDVYNYTCLNSSRDEAIGAFVLSVDSLSLNGGSKNQTTSSRTATARYTCPPSDETTMESLVGEEDVWTCAMCYHSNSGGRGICGLCWCERSVFQDTLQPDDEEDTFILASPASITPPTDTALQVPHYDPLSPPLSLQMPRPEIPLDFTPAWNDMSSTSTVQGGSIICDGRSSCCYGCTVAGYESTGSFEPRPPGSSPLSLSESYYQRLNIEPSQQQQQQQQVLDTSCGGTCHKLFESVDTSVDEDDDSFMLNLPNQPGPFPCPYPECHMIMQDSRSLYVHSQQHKWGPHKIILDENGSQNYVCCHPGCDKVFDDKKSLKKHILNHREKVFACHYPNCERKFYERAKLKRHFLVHTGEKPFVCPFENCGKRFGYNANLKTHLRTHTGSRPFPCPIANCRRRFAQASNRNIHVLTHEREGEDLKEYEGEPLEDRRVKKHPTKRVYTKKQWSKKTLTAA